MDRIGIAREIHRVHAVVGEVALQPLNPFQVGGKPMLNNEVTAKAQHVGGIKKRFFLGRDKELFGGPLQSFLDANFVAEIVGVIVFVGQARLGRGLVTELGIFVPVLLHQRAIVQVFEPATPVRHGGFENFMSDGQKHISRGHAAKLAVGMKIRSCGRLGVINGGRTIHPNAASTQLVREIIEKFVGPVDRFLRPSAPLAAHVAVFGDFGIQCRFGGWNMAVVCPAHDDMAQGVPFVPAFDFGFVR